VRDIYPLYVPLKVSFRQRLDQYARLDRRKPADQAALLLEWAIDHAPAELPRPAEQTLEPATA
jgi:hypothetical protein